MLKKILPFFFIFCLVFSLTVPCFAVDVNRQYDDIPVQNFRSVSQMSAYNFSSSNIRWTFRNGDTYLRYDYLVSKFCTYDIPSFSYFYFTPQTDVYVILPFDVDMSLFADSWIYSDHVLKFSAGTRYQSTSVSILEFTWYYSDTPDFNIDLPLFYLNIFSHSFDWLPEIVSTYKVPFYISVFIVSLLIFIFLVVFILKRITGGKT